MNIKIQGYYLINWGVKEKELKKYIHTKKLIKEAMPSSQQAINHLINHLFRKKFLPFTNNSNIILKQIITIIQITQNKEIQITKNKEINNLYKIYNNYLLKIAK